MGRFLPLRRSAYQHDADDNRACVGDQDDLHHVLADPCVLVVRIHLGGNAERPLLSPPTYLTELGPQRRRSITDIFAVGPSRYGS